MNSPMLDKKKKNWYWNRLLNKKCFIRKLNIMQEVVRYFFQTLQRRDGALCETIIMFNVITMSAC